jgi:hypothetical protein
MKGHIMNDDWMDVRWTKEQVLNQLGFARCTFEQLINRSGWTRAELKALLMPTQWRIDF